MRAAGQPLTVAPNDGPVHRRTAKRTSDQTVPSSADGLCTSIQDGQPMKKSKPWYDEVRRQLLMDPRLEDWPAKKLAYVYRVHVSFIHRVRKYEKDLYKVQSRLAA